MEDYFQRSVNSSAKRISGSLFQVETTLLDLEHLIRVELRVDFDSGLIEDAVVSMPKVPFKKCRLAATGAEALKGLRIERGVLTRVNQAIGGPRGCVHLGEVISEAIRLVGMLRIGSEHGYSYGAGDGDEDETINALKPKLANTCLVFASE